MKRGIRIQPRPSYPDSDSGTSSEEEYYSAEECLPTPAPKGNKKGRFHSARTGEAFRGLARCPQNCLREISETEFGKFEIQYKGLSHTRQKTFALTNYHIYSVIETGGIWYREKFTFKHHDICEFCFKQMYDLSDYAIGLVKTAKMNGETGKHE